MTQPDSLVAVGMRPPVVATVAVVALVATVLTLGAGGIKP